MAEPKKVTVSNIFVANGDSKDKIALAMEVSKPLSCSNTISSAMVTKIKRVRRNKTVAITKRNVIHFASLSLNPE